MQLSVSRRRTGFLIQKGKALSLSGIVSLSVRLGKCIIKVDFIVCQTLQVRVILGSYCCNRHGRDIMPLEQKVAMKDYP